MSKEGIICFRDKMFPVLGFGAKLPLDGRVSHEFFVVSLLYSAKPTFTCDQYAHHVVMDDFLNENIFINRFD